MTIVKIENHGVEKNYIAWRIALKKANTPVQLYTK